MKRRLIIAVVMMFGVSGVLNMAHAQSEAEPKRSAEEVARELSNPNTSLGTLNFNFDYQNYKGDLPGAGDQNAFTMTFQPVLPVPLGEGINFFARPAVPIVFYRDVPLIGGGFENAGFNLGDITFDSAVGKTLKNGLVLIGGMVGTLPTATDDSLAGNQLRLGPEGMAAYVGKWGAVGALVSHQWDVATFGDREDYDSSITGGQYFYAFNIKNGWQIAASPVWAYNHEASDGQKWTFPLGIGVHKTSILGGSPWKIFLEYWHYVAQPDAFGPGWQLRLSIGPVVPLPW